ncbi:NAC domain-containing protein 100-like [Dorcoceras hygrometricum]|uniref:NAC domain-containing protein 100-like n=1 Tax=Dorcoceras hygrometricum TaxID=472368 RepID=A0A2Z7D6A1_9LAMI|nr:NAC domain-containing protein 100-like [Dorcoceras hygrometricum]
MQGIQELVTDPFKRNTSDWLREITRNDDASTNLNDTVMVTYLATGSSNHRLVAPSSATAETSSQHSKMLTNTCHSLVDPRISAPAASSNHLQTPLLPADNNTSRLRHLY